MTSKELLRWGIDELNSAGIGEAESDARILLEHFANIDRQKLILDGDCEVADDKEHAFLEAIAKRLKHIPVQYITGVQNFMGIDFAVNEDTLIPRFDTEVLVEEVLKVIKDGDRIMDMCTGSGCILLSILKYSNECDGTGVDISEGALRVATANAANLDIDAKFVKSNLFESVKKEEYDIIVSNPPYIKSDVIASLMPEVREHEPMLALDGDADGLSFYRKIVAKAHEYLRDGGMLLFEIGYDEGDDVSQMMKTAGYADVRVIKDLAGLDRVVSGTYLLKR